MNKEEFEAISEGEALHFLDPHKIPWDAPCSARSFNEFFHILQYKWFRAVIDASENVGAYLDVACGTGYGTAMVGSSTCITHTVGVDLIKAIFRMQRLTSPTSTSWTLTVSN